MSEKIAAAVVGLGTNGRAAVKAALESGHCSRVVACDLKDELCRLTKEESGVPVTNDFDEVLADPDIRLVYISTPNRTHVPLGKQCLEAGKAVCMEKPMGIDIQETEDLLAVAEKTKGFLQIGFELRHYSRLYRKAKEIIDSGEIGELRHINCQYTLSVFSNQSENRLWRTKKAVSGGIFPEKLSHYVDVPRWWDGTRVVRYFATKAANVVPYYEVPDNVEATYQFESGVVSHLTFIMGAAGSSDAEAENEGDRFASQRGRGYKLYYQIVGTEGAIETNIFDRELRVFHHPGKEGVVGVSKLVRKETWPAEEDFDYFHNTRELKIDTARRVVEGLPPSIDPADAAESMRLCYELEAALEQPWRIVER